ncbi:agamous-like MADS-box protein MADS2 isoform X4 [Cicer arietinum]|uniref:MADS-box protein CMB1-like isoform X4 n=1 Tax=Cicer arietinum TaxID=3827 RepID=A0A1S2XJE1_CICAR|nr:MADS-box protein CMB1-like isoform X4 [Cicer arietinum]
MGCSRKLMNSLSFVMLRLLLLFSPTVESSMSSAVVLVWPRHLNAIKEVVMEPWKYTTHKNMRHRNILGEKLEHLDINELEQLESQLDSSLRQIRWKKTQQMLDQLSDLQRKEEMLLETNNILRNKLEEINVALQPTWEAREQNAHYSCHPPQSEEYYEKAHSNTLQIGCNSSGLNESREVIGSSAHNVSDFMHGWMT